MSFVLDHRRPARVCAGAACALVLVAATGLFRAGSAQAVAAAPALTGAASRMLHGPAGTFDLPLSLILTNPTTEPRLGVATALVFKFDKAVIGGSAVVTEGAAAAGAVAFNGNEMIVPLTGVASPQYLSVAVTGVTAADGGTGGSGSVRIAVLPGDVVGNRGVDATDLAAVNSLMAQSVDAMTFPYDVNASGTLTLADLLFVNARLGNALPMPPAPANQPPQVSAGANQAIVLPASASLSGSVADDGLPSPPGMVTANWARVAGPGTVGFANPSALSTTATFSAPGDYRLRLTANDGTLSNFADVAISATQGTPNMSFTIDGIGGSLAIAEFSLAALNSTALSGGGGSVTPYYSDAVFWATETAAAPLLLLMTSNGSHAMTAKLQIQSSTTLAALSDWTFTDVAITAFEVLGSELLLPPPTRFNIAYATVTYRVFAPDGTVAQQMCFDVKQNKAC